MINELIMRFLHTPFERLLTEIIHEKEKRMILRAIGLSVAVVWILNTSAADLVGEDYDAAVSPDYFLGSGNANSNFTVSREGGVELGLRAKLRFN